MDIGIIGLGKMGGGMAARLVRGGHRVIGHDRDADAVASAAAHGAEPAATVAEMAAALPSPRVVWLMVPAGAAVDAVVSELRASLETGDVVVDGGNSNYKDTMRRAADLAVDGVRLVDVGTSGGIWGHEDGYSMMVGGDEDAVEDLRPALETLAPATDRGWGRVGPSGSGHFVKMVHNGIEYGLMQAYAEGFAIMRAKEEFDLDLAGVAGIWSDGSVVRSWLLELTGAALADDPEMEGVAPYVPDSGEGRWTVFEAIDLDVAAPVISLSLMRRFASRDDHGYADRLLASMRNRFGGHEVKSGE